MLMTYRSKGGKTYNISNLLDQNLIGDGVGDIVEVVGGPLGTTMVMHFSASAVTKNFPVMF